MAHARQKHLHLRHGGVLPFVENDDGIVERPASHIRQGRNLDDVVVHVALDLLGLHHIVQSVDERSQVGVDLGDHVARQETEPFARLHRRPHQHDALDQRLPQHGHRHADREVSFAGAGRANAQHQIVIAHRLNVARLAVGARPDMAAAFYDGKVGAAVSRDHGQHVADFLNGQLALVGYQFAQLREGALGLVDLLLGAVDLQGVAAGDEADVERILDEAKVLIAGAEKHDGLIAVVRAARRDLGVRGVGHYHLMFQLAHLC